jgi:ribosomal protein S26
MRGKETIVVCDNCGRKVPRNKGVAFEKAISFNTGMNTTQDVRFFERRKVYYCISCAKHRGIFEKLKQQSIRHSEREGQGRP